MTRPVIAASRASALISTAAAGDRPGFGRAYADILEPELDTAAVVLLFEFIQAAYADVASVEAPEGLTGDDLGADTVDRVHRLALLAYAACSELMDVNLVVLEHVFRSVLSVSDYLASVDGYTVALYLAVLAGGLYQAARDGQVQLSSAISVLTDAGVEQ